MSLEQWMNGLTLGSIYAVVALGYALVFGVLGIINMAHGEIFMFGAYMGVVVTHILELPVVFAFMLAILVTALLGLILETAALRPLRHNKNSTHLAPLISTIGVSIFLENLAHHLFGAGNQPFRTSFSDLSFQLGPVTIHAVQLIIFFIALLLMAGLTYWLSRTKAGKALRACAENLEAASLLGVNTKRTIMMTVIIASVMGGIAGVLVGMAFNSVTPQMGLSMGLKGLAIVILGGMGSVRGAVAGGMLLGVAETAAVVAGASSFRDGIAFFIIILILLVRPQGIFGQAEANAGR